MHPLIPYFQTIKFDIPLPGFMPMEHLTVYGFGLSLAIGAILAKIVATRRAVRIGFDPQILNEAFLWAVLAVVVGGHIGYGLFYHPKEYFANPILFLDLTAGLSSFGGFIFALIAFIILFYKRKKPFWPYADCITFGFLAAWIFGRIGCTINHEHPGTATRFFLGRFCRPVEGYTIEFPQWMTLQPADLRFSHCIEPGYPPVTSYADTVPLDYAGVIAVHDMGLYEVFFSIIALTVFILLDRKPRFHGFYAMLLVLSYAPVRFMMEFLRPLEDNPRYLALTPAQWGCIAFVIISIWGMRKLQEYNRLHSPTAAS
jgi:phosphatidylglycerol:prolipoprotein diacylglycerol transferase